MLPKNNLRFYREKRGISKQKLSEITSISPSNLYHIEVGKVYPYPGWKRRIAEGLEVDEDLIFPKQEFEEGKNE